MCSYQAVSYSHDPGYLSRGHSGAHNAASFRQVTNQQIAGTAVAAAGAPPNTARTGPDAPQEHMPQSRPSTRATKHPRSCAPTAGPATHTQPGGAATGGGLQVLVIERGSVGLPCDRCGWRVFDAWGSGRSAVVLGGGSGAQLPRCSGRRDAYRGAWSLLRYRRTLAAQWATPGRP